MITWRWSGEGIKSQDRIYTEDYWDPPAALHHMANWLDCVRRRANQSATGILYVAVVFVLIGESVSMALTLSFGRPI